MVGATAFAQQAYPPPGTTLSARDQTCQRLEAQLGAIDRGSAIRPRPSRSASWRRRIGRQQAELDRVTQQSRRQGCEASGFFQIFGGAGRSEQCGPLNNQISQMRANLSRACRMICSGCKARARIMSATVSAARCCGARSERLRAAISRAGRAVAQSFRDLVCRARRPAVDQNNPGDGGASGSGYRTVCVRTCDGYFFPISFSTSQDRFRDDEATCQRMCPASEVALYSHRNPGEDMRQAVSTNAGKLYTEIADRVQIQDANGAMPASASRRMKAGPMR